MDAQASATPQAATATQLARPVQFTITDGALNTLKWIAVASMVVDHTNAYVFENVSGVAQSFGRLAFPMFAFVLGYNLARTPFARFGTLATRLAVAGLVSQPIYALMVNDAWRFNIFFTFLAAIGIIALLRTHRTVAAGVLFTVVGFFVDFNWYGIALTVASYFFASRMNIGTAAALFAALAMLTVYLALLIGWPALATLLVVPLVYVLRAMPAVLTRLRWVFYAMYPAHIAILVFGVHVLAWR